MISTLTPWFDIVEGIEATPNVTMSLLFFNSFTLTVPLSRHLQNRSSAASTNCRLLPVFNSDPATRKCSAPFFLFPFCSLGLCHDLASDNPVKVFNDF